MRLPPTVEYTSIIFITLSRFVTHTSFKQKVKEFAEGNAGSHYKINVTLLLFSFPKLMHKRLLIYNFLLVHRLTISVIDSLPFLQWYFQSVGVSNFG